MEASVIGLDDRGAADDAARELEGRGAHHLAGGDRSGHAERSGGNPERDRDLGSATCGGKTR